MRGIAAFTFATVLAVAATVASAKLHTCVHDHLDHGVTITGAQQYIDHPHDQTVPLAERQRRLAAANWQPMRIKVQYSDIDSGAVTSAEETFLKTKLVPEAVKFLENALQVVPVSGPLFAKRRCASTWQSNGKCASYDANTICGASSVHSVTIPDSMLGAQELCASGPSSCTTLPAGAGVADADFMLFVTAAVDSAGICTTSSGGTLAFANWCQKDQNDRPTFARANFCPHHLDMGSEEWDSQLRTAIHEIAHALGFTSASFPYFRDETGTPRTSRNGDGEPPEVTFTCQSQTQRQQVPSTSTIAYFAERGHDNCDELDPSSCVMKMVTPKVEAVSRMYFGCPTLQGAELENQPTAACQRVGSHWEQRIFMDAVMASTAVGASIFTPVTLALFEDSGWYKANYTVVDPMKYQIHWGFKQGCAFAMDKCLAPKSAAPTPTGTPPRFCSTALPRQCTADRSAQAVCNLASYSGLPSYYQYFTNGATGGNVAQPDYCPFAKQASNLICNRPSLSPATNYMGQVYHKDSLCFDSTLSRAIGGQEIVNPLAGCYQTECVSTSLMKVTVATASGSQVVSCTDGTTQFSISGYSGKITCLDPKIYCAAPLTFEQAAASGGGTSWIAPAFIHVASATQSSVSFQVNRFFGSEGAASLKVRVTDDKVEVARHMASPVTTLTWADGNDDVKTVQIALPNSTLVPRNGTRFFVNLTDAATTTIVSPASAIVQLGGADPNNPPGDNAATRAVAAAGSMLWVVVLVVAVLSGLQ